MSNNIFQRYIWLIDTIHRYHKITFTRIKRLWDEHPLSENGSVDFPIRTFHNHKRAIEKIFHLDILCNGNNEYYINNLDDLKKGRLRKWLFETLSVYDLLVYKEPLHDRILLEDIPEGLDFISIILDAMIHSFKMRMIYHSFVTTDQKELVIEPYFIKLFRQRWYLIGKTDTIKIYALDRIKTIQIIDKCFKYPETFEPETYFNECFGIYNEDLKIETIQIKVTFLQSKYLESLPLHHSQRLIEETNDYSIFEYYLKPSFDFKREIFSMGATVEVLTPISLRNQIKETIRNLNSSYNK